MVLCGVAAAVPGRARVARSHVLSHSLVLLIVEMSCSSQGQLMSSMNQAAFDRLASPKPSAIGVL